MWCPFVSCVDLRPPPTIGSKLAHGIFYSINSAKFSALARSEETISHGSPRHSLSDTLREALRASDAGVSLLHVRYLMDTVVGEGLRPCMIFPSIA